MHEWLWNFKIPDRLLEVMGQSAHEQWYSNEEVSSGDQSYGDSLALIFTIDCVRNRL